jgi:hypothetical protein
MNGLRVVGRAKPPRIALRVGHQFHAVMTTLPVLQP